MAVLPCNLVHRVAEIITRYSMALPGARLGVGVSGGADSVALLHILHRLGVPTAVLHVNHGLRGAESDGDEAFVRELARRLRVPFFVERNSPGEGNVEEQARNQRRRFFQEKSRDLGLSAVALGHTRSDQAETVLFRFLRGSGTAGLAGMPYFSPDRLFRPLLTTSRNEVREWAAAEGIEWREDSSNGDASYVRNRLRLQTLPDLAERYNPKLEEVVAATAEVARDEEEYWASLVGDVSERFVERTQLGISAPAHWLDELRPALARRVLRHLIRELRGDLRSIDIQHVEAVRRLCLSRQGHDRTMAPGLDAVRSFDTLLLTRPGTLNQPRTYEVEAPVGREVVLPYGAGTISVSPGKSESHFCVNFKKDPYFQTESVDVDLGALTSGGLLRPLMVRSWEPGDEITRPGHDRPEKVKTLFQEFRILLWERKHWPLLVCGKAVIWARQFGCAAEFQVNQVG